MTEIQINFISPVFLLHGVILLVSILNWKSNPFKTASVTAAISTVSILFDPFVVTPKLFNMKKM